MSADSDDGEGAGGDDRGGHGTSGGEIGILKVLPVSAKKRPSHYVAINRDMHYSLQSTSRNAYRYMSLYIAMVVFFADTGNAMQCNAVGSFSLKRHTKIHEATGDFGECRTTADRVPALTPTSDS